jgi:hypothetical protein
VFLGGAAFGAIVLCAIVLRWPHILFLKRDENGA